MMRWELPRPLAATHRSRAHPEGVLLLGNICLSFLRFMLIYDMLRVIC